MTWGNERGQTTTEYLMVSAFFTTLAIFVLNNFGVPLQYTLQVIVHCVINERCS